MQSLQNLSWSVWDYAKRNKKKVVALTVLGAIGGAVAYTAYNFKKKMKELEDILPPPPQPVDHDHMSVLR
jgi:uncharacterized membrane protein YebE (DUF533 family)